MIFVSVGTQLPFHRLINAVDEWAGNTGKNNVFAQIGKSKRTPQHLQWSRFVDTTEYKRKVHKADLIISHAGIGTIFTAIDYKKPIIIMPRLMRYGEVENEHQLATVQHLSNLLDICVAIDEKDLVEKLKHFTEISVCRLKDHANEPNLVQVLQKFFEEGETNLRFRISNFFRYK